MKHAVITVLALAATVVVAQDKPVADRGEAIARVSVPGMQCDGTCPPTVKAALGDAPGVRDVTVDFAKKSATIRYEADRTRAVDAVARLARLKPFASSQVSSVEAVFDGDYAKASATVDLKKRRARIKLLLEPKSGHAFNTERTSPDLEVAFASLPAGAKAREPLVKVKGGIKAARTFDLDVDLDAKAHGEVAVTVEVRLDDVQGKDSKSKVVSLIVPILVP
ncbi:MAG: heavy-metal-associated domain-containing protein [Planctomycetota bacterium]